jgi:hypothetical protein
VIRRGLAVRLAVFAAVVAGLIYTFTGTGDAHHVDLEVSVQCGPAAGFARITVVAVSWNSEEPARRVNPDIGITIGGVLYHGFFTPENDYTFAVFRDVPADGTSYLVHAEALAPWGPNGEFPGGEPRETTVTVPSGCIEPTTSGPATAPTTVGPTTTPPSSVPVTTEATTTTLATNASTTTAPTTTAPTTTVAGASTTASTTTAPTTTVAATTTLVTTTTQPADGSGIQVQGKVQLPASGDLARTGADLRPYLYGSAGLVLAGVAIEEVARRRRHKAS